MKMLSILLVSICSVVSLNSCQDSDDGIGNDSNSSNLAAEVEGTYEGIATIAGEDYDNYDLKVERVANNKVRVSGSRIQSEEFTLIRDPQMGSISSFEEGSHLVIYLPDEKILTIVRLDPNSSKIVFDGTKR